MARVTAQFQRPHPLKLHRKDFNIYAHTLQRGHPPLPAIFCGRDDHPIGMAEKSPDAIEQQGIPIFVCQRVSDDDKLTGLRSNWRTVDQKNVVGELTTAISEE
jgi:hypothetical protein